MQFAEGVNFESLLKKRQASWTKLLAMDTEEGYTVHTAAPVHKKKQNKKKNKVQKAQTLEAEMQAKKLKVLLFEA